SPSRHSRRLKAQRLFDSLTSIPCTIANSSFPSPFKSHHHSRCFTGL
ncbi:hypothetical protein Csa_023790, partial [Cucumis sativus]